MFKFWQCTEKKAASEVLATSKNDQKIFCIGQNKTGTTSLELVLSDMGYKLGCQREAETLLGCWKTRDFRHIINYCHTAEAFQDIPFSLEYLYPVLDTAFPQAKFILTVRDSADQWYDSLMRFLSNLVTGGQRIPTVQDLKDYEYIEKGYLWNAAQWIYGVDEMTVHDKKTYIDEYNRHNEAVLRYFQFKEEKLLVLNLSEVDSMQKLYTFLGKSYNGEKMPHLNASRRDGQE